MGTAEALRAEFGVGIDAHPGGPGSEAGVVNRAFRAAARRILESIVPRVDELEAVLTCVLRTAALKRLAEVGVVGQRAQALLEMEPGLGDAWLAYLASMPRGMVENLMDEAHENG